ncbi:Serine/threonine-protein kinase fray2 [Thalictrum thalictroides]|uniref:Serine/threonine-protein kinase fray2 n=1 Tax=Thalictrum thalictroides TaxID=46969 RepID=A0A7J6WDL9_THATH|nr:Serine/threonine-protein kinase fray2 [Thalictrum thalictroides]
MKNYPVGSGFYQLLEEVGRGASATVYKALCIPFQEIVAIKVLDFEHDDLGSIAREVQTMVLVDHPNVSKAYCSFADEHNLWVVMPYMDCGSCLHILRAAYRDAFLPEVVIATILREALKGLVYLHDQGIIHRDVKAGNILLDSHGVIQLGDLGVSACLFNSGDRQRSRHTCTGTPCWMAPEVVDSSRGYDFKADIWSFGITALELAHGHAPFSNCSPIDVLYKTLQNPPPGLDQESDKRFSKSFKQMIALCLAKDPSKRPSAKKLLKHSFFKNGKSNESVLRTILKRLPGTLGERMKLLKMKKADLIAQKKTVDEKKEELSDKEYKRGISNWNFDIEDIKGQASLIGGFEEAVPEEDQGSSSLPLCGLDIGEMPSKSEPSVWSYSLEKLNTISCNEPLVLQPEDVACPKLHVTNGDNNSMKIEGKVVQQKGRFKIISEEVDSSPMLERGRNPKKLVVVR